MATVKNVYGLDKTEPSSFGQRRLDHARRGKTSQTPWSILPISGVLFIPKELKGLSGRNVTLENLTRGLFPHPTLVGK